MTFLSPKNPFSDSQGSQVLNAILGTKQRTPSDIFSRPPCCRWYTQEMQQQKQTLKHSALGGKTQPDCLDVKNMTKIRLLSYA